ncbi:MAG: hypothetical protein U0V72_08095 [Cytophagales bacterium]
MEKRAERIKEYLVNNGIDSNRIDTNIGDVLEREQGLISTVLFTP